MREYHMRSHAARSVVHGEPLPNHSSLTRTRERYGVEVFRHF
jgi:hypothetical protein